MDPIWNLQLDGWCWEIIVEVLRLVGELVSLSQALLPHKMFVSALVWKHKGVQLPMELDYSLG